MRIGNGPRLAVPRPGAPVKTRYGYRIGNPRGYDEFREKERRRLRAMVTAPAGNWKRWVGVQSSIKPGDNYRLVDAHGKSYGPRFTSPGFVEHNNANVRRVDRQPEDYHSQLSRMLKRAHKLAMRED